MNRPGLHRLFAWGVLALSVLVSGCRPLRNGQSQAHPVPVPNGQIVLVKRGTEVGAFVFNHQSLHPELAGFSWAYRSDGQGTFAPEDPAVTRGVVTNASQVAFATFAVDWSGCREGEGWVYHSRGPTEIGRKPDFHLCVTGETNLASLDANDRRWDFRSRPPINFRELVRNQFGL